MDISTFSQVELENLGKEIGQLSAGRVSVILAGIVKAQKFNIVTGRLIEATAYFGSIHRNSVAHGHEQQLG